MNMPQQPPGYQAPPPQGPHPGQPPTQQYQTMQYGPPQQVPHEQRPRIGRTTAAVWTFGLISVVATALGLSINEHGTNAWHSVHAWGAVAILGAVLTLTPALGTSSLTPHRAWQVAVGGAAALVLFWVLFVLPAVGSNTSLIVTIGAAGGVVAAWISPGRDADAGTGQQGHTW